MVIGIDTAENDDPAGNARRFQKAHKLTYPILVDEVGKAREALGVMAFPTNLVIDAEGIVRWMYESPTPGEFPGTDLLFEALKA